MAKVEFDILFRRMIETLPRLELVEDPRWKPRFILRRARVDPGPGVSVRS